MQNDFVKTVNFRVFLVLMAFRHDFYHKLMISVLNFISGAVKPVKTALMLWLQGNDCILIAAIFRAPYKYNQCHTALGGLSSVCAKQESASCKNNEILEINVLQKSTAHALCQT